MNEIEASTWATKTHPYVAAVVIDPVDWSRFEAFYEDRPEVKIRKVDRSQPDWWTIHVACASQAVEELVESSW